jgi:hypothetical protein
VGDGSGKGRSRPNCCDVQAASKAAGGHIFFVPAFSTRALAAGPAGEVYSSGDGAPLSRLDPDFAVTPLIPFVNDLRGIAVVPGSENSDE